MDFYYRMYNWVDFPPVHAVRVTEVQWKHSSAVGVRIICQQQKRRLVLEKEVCECWHTQAIHSCIIIHHWLNTLSFTTTRLVLHPLALQEGHATTQTVLSVIIYVRARCPLSKVDMFMLIKGIKHNSDKTMKNHVKCSRWDTERWLALMQRLLMLYRQPWIRVAVTGNDG